MSTGTQPQPTPERNEAGEIVCAHCGDPIDEHNVTLEQAIEDYDSVRRALDSECNLCSCIRFLFIEEAEA